MLTKYDVQNLRYSLIFQNLAACDALQYADIKQVSVVMKGLFVRECAEGSRCSRKTLCVCVWGNVLASGERGFQE